MILLFIALTLLLSAFFSGSEIAFVAANRLRVEVSARRGGRTGALVSKFLEDPAALLTTTLVGNNLALVVYSSLAAFWLEGPLTRSFSTFMVRDFELMIEESKRAGDLDLDEEESTLLSNVFAMGSVRVKESMVPRTDLIAVEERVTIAELQATFVKSGHSKLPVYRDNIDNIVGIVFAYDLFDKPQQLDDILRSVNFVPETKMSKDLLREFLATGTSIAIVIDEYGGTAGLVTTEDLLEELFGDIQDEFDHEDHVLRVVDDRTVIASGRVDIDELRERTPIQLSDEGDYETIAGFILARLGTIPARRDEFELDGYRFQVLAASTNRVDMVRITRASELIQEEKKNGR
jgi:CBS domain containing-hemolysin-like protein